MKIIFLLLLPLFTSVSVQAQNDLIGVWSASCPTADGLFPMGNPCDLCPAVRDSLTRKLTASDFDLIVEQGGLTFRKDNVSVVMIPYTWDKKKHLLSFSFREKKYNLTARYGNQDVILQNDDGTLVRLKKKEVEIIR